MEIGERKRWNSLLSKVILFLAIIGIWEGFARSGVFPALLFPSFSAVVISFCQGMLSGELWSKTMFSLALIAKGILLGLFFALILSYLGRSWSVVQDLLDLLVAVFDPLPGVALVPLAMLWFGISEASILLIILHAVFWSILLNFSTGFRAVPKIYLEVGQNFGLKGFRLLLGIMIPASMPYLISGLKIAWARAWRAVIAVEMIFGVAAGTAGGLGWHIFMTRYFADTAGTFAGLLAIVLVGVIVEELFFKILERVTVKKWGMSA